MTQFLGMTSQAGMIEPDDRRAIIPARLPRVSIAVQRNGVTGTSGYVNDYWPGGGGLSESVSGIGTDWLWRRNAAGVASRVGFSGVTRDANGAPLAGATAILHRTTTREYVHEIVSDTAGTFLLQSVYAGEGHYIVFHKAGAPNVYGATDNTLLGG